MPSRPAWGELFIPLPDVGELLRDRAALATWHDALTGALALDLPHDLLGLWLYPTAGGVALLGPAALAADELVVPAPAPVLRAEELAVLEEIARDAGYRSAAAVPVRAGRRDVGLLLAADLLPDRYGEAVLAALRHVALRLAPTIGALARGWGADAARRERTTAEPGRLPTLAAAAACAAAEGDTPQRLAAALSRGLEPLLAHDALELLVPDASGRSYYRLGAHAGGPLWADPSLTVGREQLDVEACFGAGGRLLVGDTWREPGWPRGLLRAPESAGAAAGAELRALVGARLPPDGPALGYLLVGSTEAETYGPGDAALLARLGGLVTAQVRALLAAERLERASEEAERAARTLAGLARVAELLAAADPAEATRLAAREAERLLPLARFELALRLAEPDRVVLLAPGEARPLPDLPLVPVAETDFAPVLRDEAASLLDEERGAARLVVPLRVAGEVVGALRLTSPPGAAYAEAERATARRLADVLAPHLELLRRAALVPAARAGWKRARRGS